MATCHLITDTDFTFLGDIHLGHLHDARRKFVTNRDVEFLAVQFGIDFLVFADIVDDSLANQVVLLGVVGPLAEDKGSVVEPFEQSGGKRSTLRDDFRANEVFHSGRGLSFGESHEFLNKEVLESVHSAFVFFVEQRKLGSDGFSRCLGLDSARKEACADNDTFQRRRSLERSILHIAGFVAEDGAEEFLLGSWVAFALRSDFTDENIAGNDMSADTDDTALVEVLGGILAHIRDIGSEFLHTAFSLAHFESVFIHVDAGEDILGNHALVEHDGVLVVVTLPRHVSHLEVAAEGELAILGGVTFGEDSAFFHSVALVADRTEVDGSALVGLAELRNVVFFHCAFKTYKFLFLGAVVADADNACIDKFYDTGTLGSDLSARIANQLTFETCTDDRSLTAKQRHSLAHHVRTHEGAVGVVVLEERNECSGDRRNLRWRHVHVFHLVGCYNREVGVETRFYLSADECTIVVERSITLGDNLAFFLLGSEIDDFIVIEIYSCIFHLAIRSLDKSEVIDLGVDTE